MSSSMLGGESEVSAMSEDISLPSLSITPSKKATTQSKQGKFKFIEFDAKIILNFLYAKLESDLNIFISSCRFNTI